VDIQRHGRNILVIVVSWNFKGLMPKQVVVAFTIAARTASTKSASLYIVARTIQNTVSSIGMSILASIICISSGVVDYLKELCRYEKLQS
jgi:hypothetical protein